MRIEFKITSFDLYLFNYVHAFLSLPTQMLFIALSALIASTGSDELAPQALLLSGIIKLFWFWVGTFAYLTLYLGTSKIRNMLGARLLELRDSGLFADGEYAQGLYYWNSLHKVVERPGFAAIYVNAMTAFVIPNRAFPDAAHRIVFLDAVRARMAAPATL